MVGIVIVSHSARLAEGVVELALQMGGGEVALAAAGGLDDPDEPIGTDAFRIKEAIEEVWSEDGVLVLMDLGSAVMNAETALDFLEDPVDVERVLLCAAPLVEGAVAAVATARTGASLSEVAEEARLGLVPKAAHLGEEAGTPATAAGGMEGGESIDLMVQNRLGLHLRPAGRLVEAMSGFEAEVVVSNATTGAGPVPARSLSQVSALGVRQGHLLRARAAGPEAGAALEALRRLAADRFGDRDDEPVPPAPAVAEAAEGKLMGIGASPGVAVGPARHLLRPRLEVPEAVGEDADAAWSRIREAMMAAREDIEAQRRATRAGAGEEEAGIFTAHLLILDDEALASAVQDRLDGSTSAEWGWAGGVEAIADEFRRLDDPYQAQRVDDVEAVGQTVLAHLLGVDPRPRLDSAGVVVADDLTPGETATLDRDRVQGIVTAAGGATSHSAIIARALGVPAVVGVGDIQVAEGTLLLVDGDAGIVTVDPDPEAVVAGRERAAEHRRRREAAQREAGAPAVTRDGRTIEVAANVGSVEDAREAAAAGADGVGLLRTEFLFLGRREPPSGEDQESTYRHIFEVMDGRPVVLRTLDIGGDKPLPFVEGRREANPFLGVRGLRLGLAQPELLVTQLRAALRAGADHQLRIMFPMVAVLDEWQQARALVARAGEGITPPQGLQLGVMVEVPSLPLIADRVAPLVDFFSIGTNDLTQYTLAAERGNPALGALADALHPAVLALIERTCRAADEHGRWVGVCGELAADPLAVPVLVGMGVTELSMSAVAIPSIKQVVRRIDTAAARDLAARALTMASAEEVRLAAREFLEE